MESIETGVAIKDGLLLLSCIMSFVGASMIIATSVCDRRLRRQPGRRVICCLSVADVGSALVYAPTPVMAFLRHDIYSIVCDVQALLGMYFPMASFVWTDCLAYLVYLESNEAVKVLQQPRSILSRRVLFVVFCILSWGIPAVSVILVAVFRREGFSNPNQVETATGGWCWIRRVNGSDTGDIFVLSSPDVDQFLWEMIGGRIVEWTTIFIIVPLLYLVTQTRVRRVIIAWAGSTRKRERDNDFRKRSLMKFRSGTGTSNSDDFNHRSNDSNSDASSDTSSSASSYVGAIHGAKAMDGHRIRLPDYSLREMDAFRSRLLLVPALLLIARIWGSLRTVLSFISFIPSDRYLSWISYLQAFFDPAQGWLNAIVFILLNKSARAAIYSCCPCCNDSPRSSISQSIRLTGSVTWRDPTTLGGGDSNANALQQKPKYESMSQFSSSHLLSPLVSIGGEEPLDPIVNWEDGFHANAARVTNEE